MKSAQAFLACFSSKIITVAKAMLVILISINQSIKKPVLSYVVV
jgi:hypothetical protein